MHLDIPYYIYFTIFKKYAQISPTNKFVGSDALNYRGLYRTIPMEYHGNTNDHAQDDETDDWKG